MAEKENIIYDISVNTGNSGQSIKSVRAELRELTQQMAGLDVGSKEFTRAAQRAGELRDRMDDAQAAIKAFNPEQKFQAFAGVLGGVVNGFTALQGTMQIFGSESKDVEKMIHRTQGAIALATGVNGLLGMKDQFIILSNVIKTQVVTSFNTLGKAIRSTGIIALVAALGVLIYEWYKTKSATEAAAKALDQYNKYSEKMKELQVENMRGREKEREDIKRNMNKNLEEIDAAVKEETYTVAQGEELKKQIRINAAHELRDLETKFAKEDREKRLKDQQDIANDLIELRRAEGINTLSDAEELYALELQLLRYQHQNKLISANEYAAKKKQIEKDLADFEQMMEDRKLQAKLATLQSSGQILTQLSGLVGQSTAEGKALAIAGTTIDTYVAAFRAYTEGLKVDPTGIFSIVAAASATLAGITAVRNIANTQVPNFGGGGGSLPSSAAPSAPSFNAVSPTFRIQNANEPIITRNIRQNDSRVYVLESDITDTQERVNMIKQKARVR
jgi:Tfp pilus assembly major pilin PilA/tRNA(Leu) C34 or U34 (ribose-2'-O)-methylase TrmL